MPVPNQLGDADVEDPQPDGAHKPKPIVVLETLTGGSFLVMTVDVTQIRYSLKEPIRSVLLKQRTISLCGNNGSNMEHDRGMEKFILACVEGTRGHVGSYSQ